MEKQIKQSLLYFGGSYQWVKNDIKNLTDEVINLIKEKKCTFQRTQYQSRCLSCN